LIYVKETRAQQRSRANMCEVHDFGYPTHWATMMRCCGRNSVCEASALRSTRLRTTVAKPSEAQELLAGTEKFIEMGAHLFANRWPTKGGGST
jgi:hypothetical protein